MNSIMFNSLRRQTAYCEELIKLLKEYENRVNYKDVSMVVLVAELQSRMRIKVKEAFSKVDKIQSKSVSDYAEQLEKVMRDVQYMAKLMGYLERLDCIAQWEIQDKVDKVDDRDKDEDDSEIEVNDDQG